MEKPKSKSVSTPVENMQQKSSVKTDVPPKSKAKKPEKSVKKEEKTKKVKMHWMAKKPPITRDLRGKLVEGKCDTWQETAYSEAHWTFFFGTIFLVGISICSMLLTVFYRADYFATKSEWGTEILFVAALVLHIHAWCGARMLLWTNKLIVFKIVFGISVYTTLAIGVGIPIVTVFVEHYTLLYAFIFPAAIILADMTYVLYGITFKPNRKKVSSKLGLHLLELRKEKDHKEGKMWRRLEEVSTTSTTSKSSTVSKMSKVSKKSEKSKGSKDSKASMISQISKSSNQSKLSTVSKDSKGSKNSKMSNVSSVSKASDSKMSGK